MKTPLLELHDWVNTELKLEGYEHNFILDKIESMFNKEKELACQFAKEYINGASYDTLEDYYDEKFNIQKNN